MPVVPVSIGLQFGRVKGIGAAARCWQQRTAVGPAGAVGPVAQLALKGRRCYNAAMHDRDDRRSAGGCLPRIQEKPW